MKKGCHGSDTWVEGEKTRTAGGVYVSVAVKGRGLGWLELGGGEGAGEVFGFGFV